MRTTPKALFLGAVLALAATTSANAGMIHCVAQTSVDCWVNRDGGRCWPSIVELPRLTLDMEARTLNCTAGIGCVGANEVNISRGYGGTITVSVATDTSWPTLVTISALEPHTFTATVHMSEVLDGGQVDIVAGVCLGDFSVASTRETP